ncbi:MAG: DUF6577 family protein [Chitinophagales bacterium]
MAAENYIQLQFEEYIEGKIYLTKEDVITFYKQLEPNRSKKTIEWRIHDLQNKGIIQVVGRGIYTLKTKQIFEPYFSSYFQKIYSIANNGFVLEAHSICSTEWLNYFTKHQFIKFLYVIEVDKEALEPVFHQFRDEGYQNVFLNPNKQLMQDYVLGQEKSIVIKPLVSRAPIQEVENIFIPTLEKLLVDLVADKHIYYIYQGRELDRIYEDATDRYALNFSTLWSYAKRRNKQKRVRFLLEELVDEKVLSTIF